MTPEILKLIVEALQGSSLLPVVLLAYLLKVYVVNGNITRFFDLKKEENVLLERLERNVEKVIERQEKQIEALSLIKEGRKE